MQKWDLHNCLLSLLIEILQANTIHMDTMLNNREFNEQYMTNTSNNTETEKLVRKKSDGGGKTRIGIKQPVATFERDPGAISATTGWTAKPYAGTGILEELASQGRFGALSQAVIPNVNQVEETMALEKGHRVVMTPVLTRGGLKNDNSSISLGSTESSSTSLDKKYGAVGLVSQLGDELRQEREKMQEQLVMMKEMQANMMRMVQQAGAMFSGAGYPNGQPTNYMSAIPDYQGPNRNGVRESLSAFAVGNGAITTDGGAEWVKVEGGSGNGGRMNCYPGNGGPPTSSIGISKDKNWQRRQKYQEKKHARDMQEERVQERQRTQQEKTNMLQDHLKKMESKTTRAINRVSRGQGPVVEARSTQQKYRVTKHSIDMESGEVSGLFRLGTSKGEWVKRKAIWDPANMEKYAPAWREYCHKKGYPEGWGNPRSVVDTRDGEGPGKGGEQEPAVAGLVEEEEEEWVAWCTGHKLNMKGQVHMVLKWSDDPDLSLAKVETVMKVASERKAFGPTWLSYCDGKGYTDELFRMMGAAQVETVVSHQWDDDGRPVAEVKWKHGEVTKVGVAAAIEKGKDKNRMNANWMEYCGRIGMTDGGFLRGHVDKSKRKNKTVEGGAQKKRRGN
jgi:hypothetical protein